MKVSELEGDALDYWVARALHSTADDIETDGAPVIGGRYFKPSRDWDQGGPIIERERIQLTPQLGTESWGAHVQGSLPAKDGQVYIAGAPLVAAMRCYVASKFGEEVRE